MEQEKEIVMPAKTLAMKAYDKETPAVGITLCHCKTHVKNTLSVKKRKIKKAIVLFGKVKQS